jgi:hypothetical protein
MSAFVSVPKREVSGETHFDRIGIGGDIASEKLQERLGGKPCILDDSGHGMGIDGIGAGNGKETTAIGHDDMLTLADDSEAGFLQCTHSAEVGNAVDVAHGLCRYFDLAHVSALEGVIDGREVFEDCGSDIIDGFGLGLSLRPAAGQTGTGDAISLLRLP